MFLRRPALSRAREGGLEGWSFLIEGDGFSETVVTGPDGTIVFSDLPAGTYSITELEPPAGFEGWVVTGASWTNPDTGTVTTTFGENTLSGVLVLDGSSTIVAFGNSVPEPGTMVLLLIGGAAVLTRRVRRGNQASV